MSENQEVKITGYDVRTKTKNVTISNAVITRTSKGAFMAKGINAETGGPLVTLLNKEKAFAAIRAGIATADGFDVPSADQPQETKDSAE